VLLGPMLYIHEYAKPYIYTDITTVPSHDIGLVLGTSPTNRGEENIFFK